MVQRVQAEKLELFQHVLWSMFNKLYDLRCREVEVWRSQFQKSEIVRVFCLWFWGWDCRAYIFALQIDIGIS